MALTKVTGDFIKDGVLTQAHLHTSHGITTAHIGEGSNLYFTNARVDSRIGSLSTSDLSEGTNLYYTDARADARVALIVDSAPGTLNTLNELAAALGDDANFSTTVTNSIATKLPLAGGTMTGGLTITTSNSPGLKISKDRNTDNRFLRFNDTGTSGKDYDIINNGNFALFNNTDNNYILQITSGGNATFAGYVKAPFFTSDGGRGFKQDSVAFVSTYSNGNDANAANDIGSTSNKWRDAYFSGQVNSATISTTGNATFAGTITASGYNDSNWNTAYGWGNHASANYWVKSGSWYGDLGSHSYTRELGLSMTGGSEFVVLSKNGQGSVLVDGHYMAYESANGFFGSYNSSYGNLTGIRASAANTLKVMQLDGGNAILEVTQDARAPLFYDSNNTSYFIDPASNNSMKTVGDWRSDSSTWSGEFAGKMQYHSNWWYIQTTNGVFIRNASGANNVTLAATGVCTAANDWRAPQFYDSADTSYYLNPNGNSVLSTANFATVQISAGSSYNENIRMFPGTNGYSSLVLGAVSGDSGTGTGQWSLVRYPNPTHQQKFTIRHNTTDHVTITTAGNLTNHVDTRSPIFYSSSDTSYYLYPNNQLSLKVYGEICNSNTYQGSMQPGTLNIGRTDTDYRWDGTTWASDVRLGVLMNFSEYYEIGFHDSGDSVNSFVYYNGSDFEMGRDIGWGTNHFTFTESVRSSLFYDSNNTGYYVNPASTSLLHRVEINDVLDVRAQVGTWITSDVMSDAIGWNTSYGVYIGSNVGGTHYLRGNGTFTTGGNTYNLWHSGNDGAGTGLDADKVDGYHAAQTYTSSGNTAGSYLGGHYSSGGTEKPNSGTFGSGKLKLAMLGSSNLGFGGAWNDVLWMSSYNGGDVKRSTALVSSKYDNTSLWIVKQNYDSSSWGTGYLIPAYGVNPNAGALYASAFYDSNSTSYYLDPASTSNVNAINANGQFATTLANGFRVDSGTYARIDLDSNSNWSYVRYQNNGTVSWDVAVYQGGQYELRPAGSSTNVWTYTSAGHAQAGASSRAPIFYDSNDTNYYMNYYGAGKLRGNFEFAANSTSTSYNNASIELRESNYTANGTATPPFIGFHWGGVVASSIAIESNGRIAIKNNPGNAYENFIAKNIYGQLYYDSDNTSYYVNPASTSNLNAATFVGTVSGQNAYFAQDVAIGFTSGNIGGNLNVKNSAAGQIAAKLQLGSSVNSSSTGVFVNTTASYASSGMFLHFQSNHISGDDNVLIAYLDGDIVNKNNSYTQYSDEKLKENIVDATDKLEEVKQIKVRNFNFKGEDLKQIGVVAQELESIFPALVKEREVPGYEEPIKTVKYSVLVPILIKAMQEQQTIIDDLKSRLETLENQ
jgi:hypothetical protein